MIDETPAIGHNRAPVETALEIHARLDDTHDDVIVRVAVLAEAETRLPDVVDDENKGQITDFLRQIADCRKWINETHSAEKRPFLDAGKAVDGWRNTLCADIEALAKRVQTKLNAFVAEQDRLAREAMRLEAKRLAEVAKAEAAAGDKASAAAARTEARELRDDAKSAPSADLVRARTGTGGVLSAKTDLDFEIKNKEAAVAALWQHFDDEALAKAVRSYKRQIGTEALVNQVNARKQPVPGVRFTVTRKALVR